MIVKENVNKRKNIPCSWIRRPDIVEMVIFAKLICRFNVASFTFPADLFVEMGKPILDYIWNARVPGCEDMGSLQLERGPSPAHAGSLIPASRTVRNKLVYKSSSIIICYSSLNR